MDSQDSFEDLHQEHYRNEGLTFYLGGMAQSNDAWQLLPGIPIRFLDEDDEEIPPEHLPMNQGFDDRVIL